MEEFLDRFKPCYDSDSDEEEEEEEKNYLKMLFEDDSKAEAKYRAEFVLGVGM